jgi:hypothetical protein
MFFSCQIKNEITNILIIIIIFVEYYLPYISNMTQSYEFKFEIGIILFLIFTAISFYVGFSTCHFYGIITCYLPLLLLPFAILIDKLIDKFIGRKNNSINAKNQMLGMMFEDIIYITTIIVCVLMNIIYIFFIGCMNI